MTESTLLQTTENNNTTTSKMDRPVSPTPSDQQYALKWNDFQSSILSSFRHLRDEEDFVDVTLACDIRSFTAHKVVLSACSPYFRKLLKANPCEHPIVILRDIRAEDVENLLRFMYNGEVHIGHEQLNDFLKTAQLLQVRGLADVNGPQPKSVPVPTNLSAETNLPSSLAVNALRESMLNASLPSALSNSSKMLDMKPTPSRKVSWVCRFSIASRPTSDRVRFDRQIISSHPYGKHQTNAKTAISLHRHHRNVSRAPICIEVRRWQTIAWHWTEFNGIRVSSSPTRLKSGC